MRTAAAAPDAGASAAAVGIASFVIGCRALSLDRQECYNA